MSYPKDTKLDRTFWVALILGISALIVSIISLLFDDAMLFAIFLSLFFGFGFYAYSKRDQVKKATYYRIHEEDKRKAREILYSGTKRRFSRNKKIGLSASVLSFVISIILISYEEFMLFGLFIIISAVSAVVALRSWSFLDNPNLYFREQNLRSRPPNPHRYTGNAHKYLLVSTIVSLGIFIFLEDVLSFENMIDYWISGIFGLIGVMGIFFTIAAWPRKNL